MHQELAYRGYVLILAFVVSALAQWRAPRPLLSEEVDSRGVSATRQAPADSPTSESAVSRRAPANASGASYLVVVLAAAYFLAFLDRQSLGLFVVPIEHDLRLSDGQMGLLLGLAFGLLYSVLGVPFGLLADRVNRRRLVLAGVTCWSLATLITALAASPLQMFTGRIGVGIGEATLAPAAASMINDAFAPGHRGRAFGLFSLGTSFGSGTASLLGAGVIALLAGRQFNMPVLGTLQAWQLTLLVVAVAGVPIIIATLGIREPPRTARGAQADARQNLGFLARHYWLFGLVYLTNVLASLMAYSFYPWIPAALERSWHLSRADIGVHLGAMIIVLSGCGIYLSGWLVDRLNRLGMTHAVAAVGTIVFLVLACVAGALFRMPSVTLTWTLIGVYIFLVHIYFPFALIALSIVTPPSAMAVVSAINFMLTGILGLSLGPLLVVSAQHFFPGPRGTGLAISAVCTVLALLGAIAYACLWQPLKRWVTTAQS